MLAFLLSALITGHVLTDTGSPVVGVAVSDGVTIAQTDANGAYELPYRDNAEFVFVSVPSGYDIPLDEGGSPLIYKRVNEAGTYDFTLHQQAFNNRTKEIKCDCITTMVCFDTKTNKSIPIPDYFRYAVEEYEGYRQKAQVS